MLKKLIHKALKDNSVKYVAKMDIKKFFFSVDNKILIEMFKRKIKDKDIIDLVSKIIDNGGKGLPIGYYTSQWFSNFYLEGLDHFIKEKLRIKHYVRYVDDLVLLDSSKEKLHNAIKEIKSYLGTIHLTLKKNYQVWKLDSRPIDFIGYKFYKKKTFLRKRIYKHLIRRINRIKSYTTIHQARGMLSLIGYLEWVSDKYKEIKQKLCLIVSNYDRKRIAQ